VDGANQGALSSFTFTAVSANHTIRAVFAINQYTITSTAGANGTIAPLGATIVNHGSNQSYTVTPNTGYHVDSLLVDGANQGQLTSFTFTNVTAPHTIRAVFAINQYTITSTTGANGTIAPLGATIVNHGSNQSYTLTPNTGYHVDSLIVDGANQGQLTSFTFTNVTVAQPSGRLRDQPVHGNLDGRC
jgi:LysM repeat protein